MIVLGIDTCGGTATIALVRVVAGKVKRLAETELAGRTAAALMVPALEQMLREAGLTVASLAAIVVVDGPGSFTGIRIGLSAAKGLAEALRVQVFAVSRLRVLAGKGDAGSALLDAGRGEFYYRDEVGSEALHGREDLASMLPAGARPMACEAKVASLIAQATLVSPPTAFDAVRTALSEVLGGAGLDQATLDGRYLRRSDVYQISAAAVPNG